MFVDLLETVRALNGQALHGGEMPVDLGGEEASLHGLGQDRLIDRQIAADGLELAVLLLGCPEVRKVGAEQIAVAKHALDVVLPLDLQLLDLAGVQVVLELVLGECRRSSQVGAPECEQDDDENRQEKEK